MKLEINKEEYGEQYAGIYVVSTISWKLGRELLRKAIKAKDPTEYIEDLVLASVSTSPLGTLSKEKMADLPHGLMRKLMEETMKLNDVSRSESAFLST
ncbi:MAG TPA: hypothetical protein VFE98_02900 [Candidatus Bathyarchaeia archaeon]|nr:hypothetical protein [Candidatus Bathyarchaeia archaeon]